MSWSNQGGGPWGVLPGGGRGPSNLEEILRRGQDRVRGVLPGGFGSGRGVLLVGLNQGNHRPRQPGGRPGR